MFILSFSVEYDNEKNILRYYNLKDMETRPLNSFIRYDVGEIDDPELCEHLKFNIFESVDEGREFVYKFHPKNLYAVYTGKNLVGISLGDVFPELKDFYYPIFRRVLKSRKTERISSTFYNDREAILHIFTDVIYKNGDICVSYVDSANIGSYKEGLDNYDVNADDFQKSSNVAAYYSDNSGTYYWTPEVYDLIERDPRSDDNYYHIIRDLLDEKDRIEVTQVVNDLNPNEFLGDHDYKITLESGKIKYIRVNAHNFYDKDGNFVQLYGYIQDITEDFLKTQELKTLKATIGDIQHAAEISVHYLDANGKFHWTPETYSIIDRKPRPGDEDRNIILELMDSEWADSIKEGILDSNSGEFYGDGLVSRIVTESGKVKYLRGSVRKICDENGNFVRRSEFAQDITKQFKYQRDLIQANKDKTILVQEVHHRIKNNLQLITSFINLEQKFHNDDPERILDITKKRLKSLALIHETIYREDDLSSIMLNFFFKDFDNKLFMFSTSDDIKSDNDIENDLRLSVDKLTPLTLMVNELTTNSFKYAFPDEFSGDKRISKSIHTYVEDGLKFCKFKYSDSGVGLPNDFELDNVTSLGWIIIKSLIGQLDGEFELFNDNGFNLIMKFPIN